MPLTREIETGHAGEDPSPAYAARRRLERAFRVLRPDDRALVTLHELQGWGIGELAELNGKSEGSIRVRLSRARGKMREELARHYKRATLVETSKPERGGSKACVVQKPARD